MNIPRHIRIGAQWYDVVSDPSVADSDACGDCNTVRLKIRIDPTMPISRQHQTLVHEIVEAANHEYDLKLEHHTIEQLECALYQVIVDNPGMFEAKDG